MAFAVGGHKDSIHWDGGSVLKKYQDRGRGAKEVEFLLTANSHPFLQTFAPKFFGCRDASRNNPCADGDEPAWIEMENLLQGMSRPMVMDLKMGVTTYGPDASEAKKAEQIAKAVRSTTPTLGVRIVGASMPPRDAGGDAELIGAKYKAGEPTDAASLAAALARFLPSRRLRAQALRRARRVAAWFEEQREFAFARFITIIIITDS
jgi:hypothetical protein